MPAPTTPVSSPTVSSPTGAQGRIIRGADHAPGDPLWYKDAVIYQLHVKSFQDGNDDGIGDFPGLISRLDYIAALGVDTIWLLPFYPSPLRDDGYDIADYRDVNRAYGTLGDFKRFLAEAHARGLRVITELVINHTSDAHPWFQRARRARRGSAQRDFYVWSDDDRKYPETRIIFLDTEKSNWTWDPVAGAYYWHRFYSHQPDLNFDNPRVLDAVLKVMRFWLDMGVDGLRLDAVPYLIEREGTNNENLPETHDVLKKIRAHLDEHYSDRMLLAEANQWPEDTQEYFGAGDECHMAFHFPLMPRMYMSIAQEDRFPITDIMRQTPDIPENCQWAIFLRNHDELTLEMVTETERTFLWETYASDRRARINLGIRRRLAPLLDRDRRRIELMHSLLLTMPGTPVLYYGDEIGMGDNVHLGDRDGVRTPMQWSPDRNGGFSRADPEQLILPAIMSPLYGHAAVNVETQSRDPHSLLHWTRRMLQVRRRFRAFGRGRLDFLFPGNRRVLAYLRADDNDTVLCVANLSRTAQAVELDLSRFEGRVPMELVGGAAFPPIGQLPYLLTLPPYGFYAFALEPEGRAPVWHLPAPEPLPEHETFVLRRGLAQLLETPHRDRLSKTVLPAWLAMRRWFAGGRDAAATARLDFADPLPGTDGEILVTGIAVARDDGTEDHYALPLGILWEADRPDTPALPVRLALARVRQTARVGLLTDGFALEGFGRALMRALADGGTEAAPGARLALRPGSAQAVAIAGALPPGAEVRWMAAEQTNSSVIVGDTAVIKLIRRIQPGINPEVEMARHLTEAGYAGVAEFLGELAWEGRIGEEGSAETASLAVIQRFIRNQGDGWHWTGDQLARALDALHHHDRERLEDATGTIRALTRTIGHRLKELHEVLARPSEDVNFAPEIADPATITAWNSRIGQALETAFDILADHAAAGEDTPLARAARSVLTRRRGLAAAVAALAEAGTGATLTRIHGDFHLGQLLVSTGDVTLIDFEGEPTRPLALRRAKDSPWRDVAGLLRSIDYVTAMPHPAAPASDTGAGLEPDDPAHWLLRLRGEMERAFLAGYAGDEATTAAPDLPALLKLFLIEKAAYEVAYEARLRPDWLLLPAAGLARLAERLVPEIDDVAPDA
ncbi:maltose alpha-D-glucosyltransferase (plasmid) [Tistrella mobilis]|uniref:maltose alpha-D-glucosyltransferase n=1 Tax=Tistrella mobilis TaxID=171437 RepID=UPI0009EDE329|nr:maltose alpha-D-glucosyltransferase [Tistrella mobilis]